MGSLMTQKKEHWIAVKTEKGMFSDECAIIINLYDGSKASLFAHRKLIKQENGKFYLKVFLVDSDPQHHKQRVLLPSETFETSSRWVEVPA